MEDDPMDAYEHRDNEPQAVYMACILQGHRLGVAYYECFEQKLFVLEAWEEGSNDLPCIQILKDQIQPTVIYTSTKMDDHFLDALKTKGLHSKISCLAMDLSPDIKQLNQSRTQTHLFKLDSMIDASGDVIVKAVKSSVFSYEQAWHRLAFVQVDGMIQDLSVKERIYLLRSMMNLDSEMQVRAAGGLLQILEDEMIIDHVKQTNQESSLLQLQTISEISLNSFLNIDVATYAGLQIFQSDKHPSHMGIGKAKEGVSLYGIFADKVGSLWGIPGGSLCWVLFSFILKFWLETLNL